MKRFPQCILASGIAHLVFSVFCLVSPFLTKPVSNLRLEVNLVELPKSKQTLNPVEKASDAYSEPLHQHLKAKPIEKELKVSGGVEKRKKSHDHFEKKWQQTLQNFKQKEPIRGNVISSGNSLTDHSDTELEESYLEVIRQKIHAHFMIPPWLKTKRLRALLTLKISPNGENCEIQWKELSGNEDFDHAVQKALDASLPFPPTPVHMKSWLAQRGLLLAFPL